MSGLFADYAPREAGSPRAKPPADLVVRRAGLRDVGAIARLLVARNGWDEDTTVKRTEHGISIPPDAGFYAVAETAGAVVGFARAARYAPPDDAPPNAAPAGWYLLGVSVDPAQRRRGIAHALTRWRLEVLAGLVIPGAPNADHGEAFYFASASNRASIDLHAALGFVEVTRDFWFPAVEFERKDGVLFRLGAAAAAAFGTPG